jgi:alkanesulfonate monooxygenase SsuD/methylene tetrahydromethanopterin reductase-like flavin-dependent oxidoreductase (luciferase family)
MWYMRNVETAAMDGMNTVIVGSLDSFEANVARYHELWTEHQGAQGRTIHGTEPKIGLVNHLVLADSEAEAVRIARPAWGEYVWNLEAPRRLEAEQRGLMQFLGSNMNRRPAGLPEREADRERYRARDLSEAQRRRRATPGGIGGDGHGAGFSVIAGTPDSIRTYMDEYVATGANYFVCSFQWGGLTHAQAMRSIDLFVAEIMPHYR